MRGVRGGSGRDVDRQSPLTYSNYSAPATWAGDGCVVVVVVPSLVCVGAAEGDDDADELGEADDDRDDDGDGDERTWLALGISGIVIFLATPQWWVPHSDGRELEWGPIAHVVGNAYLIWGLAFLVIVGLRAARLGRPDLGSDPERPVILDKVLARNGAESEPRQGA